MTFTAPFKAAWARSIKDVRTLARIELTDRSPLFGSLPATRTINLASDLLITPDSVTWENALTGGWIRDRVPYGATDAFRPSTGSLTLVNRRLSFQPDGERIANLLHQYRWKGAKVSIWIWLMDLSSFSDAGRVVKDFIIDGIEPSETEITLSLVQRKD